MAAVQTPEPTLVPVNGITIAYDTFGDPADPTLLLVMGLGASRVAWDQEFAQAIADRGFHVVRFDNRDVGASTRIDTPDFDPTTAILAAFGGDTSHAVYTLDDMVADTAGLIEHLDVGPVHVVGASMGGMIAQGLAISRPDLVRSLTSIMSTTGDPSVGTPDPALLGVLGAERPTEREASIAFGMDVTRQIGSPDHWDPERARARATREYEAGLNPLAVPHQLLAIIASGSRADGLAALDVPTLVVHGRQDRLVGFSGGEATAALVPDATFLAIDDMAHDLPPAHAETVVDAIVAVTERAG
jgi:pimeloyl-ACP methyl ester carboxylesterase